MKLTNCLMLTLLAFVLIAMVGSVAAQSTDRDHPTLLTSNELRGDLEDNKDEHFYSFTAGPGELTITADIEPAKGSGTTNISFELLDRNGANAILCCEYVQGDFGATGRVVKSIKLNKRQTLILHTTNNGGNGTFRFRFSGAAVSGGSTQRSGNDQNVENNRNSNQIIVPSKGTLRIKMKNGSTKEIDLSLVREISVQP